MYIYRVYVFVPQFPAFVFWLYNAVLRREQAVPHVPHLDEFIVALYNIITIFWIIIR